MVAFGGQRAIYIVWRSADGWEHREALITGRQRIACSIDVDLMGSKD